MQVVRDLDPTKKWKTVIFTPQSVTQSAFCWNSDSNWELSVSLKTGLNVAGDSKDSLEVSIQPLPCSMAKFRLH
jgi:hypothetical protein